MGGIGTALEIGGFGPGSSGDLAARFPFNWYVNILYKRLWESWEMKDAGTRSCAVAFTILKDGSVKDISLESPSGDAFFDQMAQRAVEVSSPFPPLPEGFQEPSLRVIVRFKLQ